MDYFRVRYGMGWYWWYVWNVMYVGYILYIGVNNQSQVAYQALRLFIIIKVSRYVTPINLIVYTTRQVMGRCDKHA